MKKILSNFILLILIYVLSLQLVSGTDYYVDIDSIGGSCSDSNLGSIHLPFCSIQHASDVSAPGDNIYVRAGLYHEQIFPTNSGTDDQRIIFQNYQDEEVILNGGVEITSWTLCTSQNDCGNNPNWNNIYYADYDFGTSCDNGICYPQLITENDVPFIRAQEPNQNNPYDPYDSSKYYTQDNGDADWFIDNELTDEFDYTDAYLNVYMFHIVYDTTVKVSSFNPTSGRIDTVPIHPIQSTNFSLEYPSSTRVLAYSFWNKLDFLDMPGEYYVDVSAKRIYIWPYDNSYPENIVANKLTNVFDFDTAGSNYITVDGFTVNNYNFNNARSRGMFNIGTTNPNNGITIKNCNVFNNAGSAVYMVDDNDIVIENNNFFHNGMTTRYAYGIASSGTNNVEIKNNHIYENTYDGVYIQGGQNYIIDGNHIHTHNSSRTHHDGLKIESMSIDDVCSNYIISNNIVHGGGQTIYIQGLRDSIFYNNIAYDADENNCALRFSGSSTDGHEDAINIKIYNNIFLGFPGKHNSLTITNEADTIEVRNNILDGFGPPDIPNFVRSHNLYIGLMWNQADRYGWSLEDGEFINENFDEIFVDYDEYNLALLENSPAIDSGIDLSTEFDVDILGINRPQGFNYDVGAFEYNNNSNINNPGDCSGDCTNSLTQYGITWTFDKEYNYGQYANGDYYVVSDEFDTVTIIDINPNSIDDGTGRIINGAMINIEASTNTQGFDSNLHGTYDPILNVAYGISESSPLVLESDDSLISSISSIIEDPDQTLDYQAILTVVKTAPSSESFRPPFVNTNKTINYNYNDINLNLLQNISIVGTMPSWSEIEERLLPPYIGYSSAWWVGHNVAAFLVPERANYGREISRDIGTALLAINTNTSLENKKKTIIALVQRGIDNYGLHRASVIENDRSFLWWNDGGIKQGHKLPILVAGVLLDDTNMKNIGFISEYFHEDGQTFYITQEDVDRTTRGSFISTDFDTGVYDELVSYEYLDNSGVVTDKTMAIYQHNDNPFNDITGLSQTVRQTAFEIIRAGQSWWPDYRTEIYIEYTEADIGIPEWGIRHSTNPSGDNAYWKTNYRECCNAITHYGDTLAILVMGLDELWNNDAFFDYQYRYYEIEFLRSDPFGSTPVGSPSVLDWGRGGWGEFGRWNLAMFEEHWDDYYTIDSWTAKFRTSNSYHDADINENNIIEITELNTYVQTWRSSSDVTLADLISAIKLWKQ